MWNFKNSYEADINRLNIRRLEIRENKNEN